MSIIELVRSFKRKGRITAKQARAICDSTDVDGFTYETGMGRTLGDTTEFIASLNREFAPFKFRFIMCHDRERTYFALTYKDPDPREYEEMTKHGYWDADGDYHKYRKKKA